MQHPLWLAHTDHCRVLGYVCMVCVCMWKKEPSLIFTQAVQGLGISRHGEGRGKTPRQQGREQRERKTSFPLILLTLQRLSVLFGWCSHTSLEAGALSDWPAG